MSKAGSVIEGGVWGDVRGAESGDNGTSSLSSTIGGVKSVRGPRGNAGRARSIPPSAPLASRIGVLRGLGGKEGRGEALVACAAGASTDSRGSDIRVGRTAKWPVWLSAIRFNCRIAAPRPITISPPTKAVVPEMIRVFPRLNSLIGMPKPIMTMPAAAITVPSVNKTKDMPSPCAAPRLTNCDDPSKATQDVYAFSCIGI